MTETPNAVFYGRVSTDRQDTYDEQIAAARRFCDDSDHLALDEQAHFYESGVTAEYFSHESYLKMLDYVREHPNIRYIIVRDLSRFGRADYTEMIIERERLRREYGVEVLSAMEPHLNRRNDEPKLDEYGDPIDDPLEDFIAPAETMTYTLNRRQRRILRKKSKDGIVAALERGEPPGGRMSAFFCAVDRIDSYGHPVLRKNGLPSRRVIPNPQTREHHQAMFDFIASGGSFGGLSRWLAERGVFSPGIRLRSGEVRGTPGKPFAESTLKYAMWANYMFIGQYAQNKLAKPGPDNLSHKRFRPKEYWQIIEDYCEPTVDPTTFFKVQDIIERGERVPLRNAVLLTGLLKCGICGRRMHAVPSGASSVYRCNGKKLKDTNKCPATEVQVSVLDSLVERRLLNEYFSADYLERFFCHGLPEMLDKHSGAREAAKREIAQRMQELEDEIAQAESVQGAPPAMIEEYIHRRRAELNSLKRRREGGDTLRPRQIGFSNLVNFDDLSAALRDWWEKAKLRERREFLRLVFSKLVFTRKSRQDDGDLEIHTRLPAFAPNRSVQRGESGIRDTERLRSPREIVHELNPEDTLGLPDDILALVAALQEKYEKNAQAAR